MAFQNLPRTAVIVSEIILLGTYLAVVFGMFAAQSHQNAQTTNERIAVSKLRFLENDILTLAEKQGESAVGRALKDLAEEFHFSDAEHFSALSDVEDKIVQNIALLEEELTEDGTDPMERIVIIRNLLKERNRTLAVLKR